MPRDAPVMTTTFRSDVMFALFHDRGCIRASRYANEPNAPTHRLLNCCHFLLLVLEQIDERTNWVGTARAGSLGGFGQGELLRAVSG
jgi:hypothetical protein